ncbi:MAG: response regulator transcription factor [Ignavibacteriales bacterium]|nr:response regulator transcription factor [Ignavibacteriales bacterium]
MKILIIEDEEPASERIIAMVREFDPSIHILGTLQSVQESLEWLRHHASPDLIIVDIQLNDGLSLEIFKTNPVPSPLIFTTAYDEYLMKAFEFNSIDYLLKPIQKEKLHNALTKYLRLKQHFADNLVALFEQLQKRTTTPPNRLVVKRGTDFVSLKTDDVAYFYTEHKIVFLIGNDGKRYIIDKPLAELENELDKNFFRVNRKYLVHINAVVRFKPHEKGKALVDLTPAVNEEVIVSQENASAFKRWIGM